MFAKGGYYPEAYVLLTTTICFALTNNVPNREAACLIRVVLSAVKHIHEVGIVHRDLKPENMVFKTEADDSELLIADFGLSVIMVEKTSPVLTEAWGTRSVSQWKSLHSSKPTHTSFSTWHPRCSRKVRIIVGYCAYNGVNSVGS